MSVLADLRAGKLAGATQLDLSHCGLDAVPAEVFDLADSLELLNLSGNRLAALPAELPRLRHLRILFGSQNRFTELPPMLGECAALSMIGFKSNRIGSVPASALPPGLRWLILSDNEIEQLPDRIGACPAMQKLMLAGNRLSQLPDAMAALAQLELLRISANRFSALPEWLLSLPRLSWLAFGGNPLTLAHEEAAREQSDIAAIDWFTLQLAQTLGEGASGVIHRADHAQGEVAVKLFRGELTSDGMPASEKAAALAAGAHPALIPLHGRIGNHPEGRRGLVMPLIDAAYANLAQPPSFASCTRDIYRPEQRFAFPELLSIAAQIADVAAHLHARGVMHGDLYGHNILIDGNHRCLLGDFGASSFIPPGNRAFAERLQRIEVRAFGCLLEELMQRCLPTPAELPRWQALAQLQQQCLDADPAQRPLFAELVAQLAA